MIKGCKICGIKDLDTLDYIINHIHPPNLLASFVITQKAQDMLMLTL